MYLDFFKLIFPIENIPLLTGFIIWNTVVHFFPVVLIRTQFCFHRLLLKSVASSMGPWWILLLQATEAFWWQRVNLFLLSCLYHVCSDSPWHILILRQKCLATTWWAVWIFALQNPSPSSGCQLQSGRWCMCAQRTRDCSDLTQLWMICLP